MRKIILDYIPLLEDDTEGMSDFERGMIEHSGNIESYEEEEYEKEIERELENTFSNYALFLDALNYHALSYANSNLIFGFGFESDCFVTNDFSLIIGFSKLLYEKHKALEILNFHLHVFDNYEDAHSVAAMIQEEYKSYQPNNN